MTMRSAELVMGVLTLLLSIGVMIKSAELNIGWVPERGPGGGAWPFWLAAGMALASTATIVRWFLRLTPESRSTEPYIDNDTVFLVVISTIALFGLILMMEFIGTYLALFIFLVFYLRVIGRHSWYATLSLSLAAPTFVFCLFEWALQKDIPKGSLVPEGVYYPIYDVIYAPNALVVGGILAGWIVAAILVGGLEERCGRKGLTGLLLVMAVGGLALAGAGLGLYGQTGVLAGLVLAALAGLGYHLFRRAQSGSHAGGAVS